MNRYFFLIILFAPIGPVSAQENKADSVLLEQIYGVVPVFEVPQIRNPQFKKTDFGFQAGTSMLMFGRKEAIFSSYIAPELRFHVTPRLQVNTGVLYQKGFIPGFGEGHTSLSDGRFDSYTVFAEGQYNLTEKFSVSGMVLKELGTTLDSRINTFQKNTQSMSFGAQYRITDHMSVGAQIRVYDGYPMNQLNPYHRHDTFRNPSYFSADPWW